MFRYFLFFVFLFAAFHSSAQQDSSSIKHNSDSSIKSTVVETGKYRYIAYTDANNTVLSREEIKSRLLSYQPSAEEFKSYKTSKVFFGIFTGAVLTSGIIGENAYHHNDKVTTNTAIVFSVGFLVGEIISGLIIAPHHFKKSLQLYNKQFL